MKKIIFGVISVLVSLMSITVLGATSAPTHETYYDAAILRSLTVPTAGLVVTVTTPGVVFLTPVTNKIYVNLTATTPNASVFMFPITVGSGGNTEQYFKVGDKLAIFPDTGTTVVNMTTQVWKVLPQ